MTFKDAIAWCNVNNAHITFRENEVFLSGTIGSYSFEMTGATIEEATEKLQALVQSISDKATASLVIEPKP